MAEGVRLTLPCYLSAHQGISQTNSFQANPRQFCLDTEVKWDQHLGSLGPHHTPIPLIALRVPFAIRHAPSEYTISIVVFSGAATTGSSAGVFMVLDVDWSGGGGFEVETKDGFEMNPTDGFDGM